MLHALFPGREAFAAGLLVLLLIATAARAEIVIDVLGSGGPELTDGRTSTSYLVHLDDGVVLLIDTGPGSARAFEHRGADFTDIRAILYTHLHVDHSADLPAYVKGGYFTARQKDLAVFGPHGNHLLPSVDVFLQRMFGADGVYPYLADYLPGSDGAAYQLVPTVVSPVDGQIVRFDLGDGIAISAVAVEHGPLPALAWRVETPACAVTFTGDGNGEEAALAALARDSNLLVAHLAVEEDAGRVARNLHMPPSLIGRLAAEAGVDSVLLSHRMRRTDGREAHFRQEIAGHYVGALTFAEDGSRQVACP